MHQVHIYRCDRLTLDPILEYIGEVGLKVGSLTDRLDIPAGGCAATRISGAGFNIQLQRAAVTQRVFFFFSVPERVRGATRRARASCNVVLEPLLHARRLTLLRIHHVQLCLSLLSSRRYTGPKTVNTSSIGPVA